MPPVHFTVSQIRTAAACPRILYFDAAATRARRLHQPSVTRIWKAGGGGEATACGTLFHAAIERFNRLAAIDPHIRETVGTALGSPEPAQELLRHVYQQHVNRDALFRKTAEQQQAFMAALGRYLGELVDILRHAVTLGKPLEEILDEMLGDKRRRVDVTFQVGSAGEEVHVTGILDYVFYDWRTANHRIIDYKLTPADKPANDLFQVCVYALMHHVQHRTEPDVGVLYLHPARQMIEKPWEQVFTERHKVFNLLASMREWVSYHEKTGKGLHPPGEPVYCPVCKWDEQCVKRLGPKHEGQRLEHWTASSQKQGPAEPPVVVSPTTEKENEKVKSAAQTNRGMKKSNPQAQPPTAESPPKRAGTSPGLAAGELWLGEREGSTSLIGLPCSALPTHVAVVGAAGSGKTWLAKVIAEEAVGQGIAVLAVDPQGDLVQLIKRRDPRAFPGPDRKRYDAFWSTAEPCVLTPGSSHGTRLSLNPVRVPRGQDLANIIEPQRRDEELAVLLTIVAGNLVGLAKAAGDPDCQQTFLFQILRSLTGTVADPALSLERVAAAVSQPDTVGMEDAERFIKKAEREKLARKLNTLIFGPSANLFSGGLALDLEQMLRPAKPGKVPLNVVYLNALGNDDQKQFLVAALAAEIYRWMITTGSRGTRPRLLFYLDEARDYIPAGTAKPPAKEPLLRLFAQGRKYGVACLFCTQSPRSVDYNVFGNCSTKIVGRLESAQDVTRVAEWFQKEGGTPGWLGDRKGAAPGTFVGRWPGMPVELDGQTWKGRQLFSEHGGAWSPGQVEQEVNAQRGSAVR